MADRGQNPHTLEELSIEELREKIEEDKKNAKRSTAFAAAALIAIIALCIAWFVANYMVTGTSSSVSAKSDVLYRLASVGTRQSAEESYLKLQSGTTEVLDSYIDLDTGNTIETEQTYHVGEASLAWYMNGQESFQPGASGKMEFYIIPTQTGAKRKSVEITFDVDAYQINNSKAQKTENTTLQKLVNGHILLFRHSGESGYSNWLNPEEKYKMTLDAPDEGFKEGVPYKVTVYWVWPKYFRNYIYNSRSEYGDLFTNTTSDDYKNLVNYININNKENIFSNKSAEVAYRLNKEMTEEQLSQCSQFYDEADEYIGQQKCYVYINASVK